MNDLAKKLKDLGLSMVDEDACRICEGISEPKFWVRLHVLHTFEGNVATCATDKDFEDALNGTSEDYFFDLEPYFEGPLSTSVEEALSWVKQGDDPVGGCFFFVLMSEDIDESELLLGNVSPLVGKDSEVR